MGTSLSKNIANGEQGYFYGPVPFDEEHVTGKILTL
jgi:hypothetical protein